MTGLKIFMSFYGAVVAGAFFVCPVVASAQDEEGDIQFAPEDDSSSTEDQSDMMYKDEDEQTKPEPAPAPAPAAPKPAPAPAAVAPPAPPAEATPALDLSGGRREVLFGSYRVRIGMARPDFEKLRFYKPLYGKPSDYPTLAADWFFWDWYATLGISFRGGFYTDEGKAASKFSRPIAKIPDDVTDDDVKADDNSKSTLTLIPLQACLTAEITPLRQKWLVVDGYIGLEYLYWQEVRETKSGATASSSAAVIQSDKSAEAADDALTNKGLQKGTVLGVSANILLNGLDEASANSMRGALGLGNIYLSPFLEYVRTLSKAPDFSRTSIGIGFTFESIK